MLKDKTFAKNTSSTCSSLLSLYFKKGKAELPLTSNKKATLFKVAFIFYLQQIT